MTIALGLLACWFAWLWWRTLGAARAWRAACDGWREACDGWRNLSNDWQALALREAEARQYAQDQATFWEAVAMLPMRPTTLAGKVQ